MSRTVAYIAAMTTPPLELGRRTLFVSGAAALVGALAGSTVRRVAAPPRLAALSQPPPAPARPISNPDGALDPRLLRRALEALDEHAGTIRHRDRIAIVDFSAPSSEARFHFLDVASGRVSRQLVAHGSGSDPGHTGFLHRFSNLSGSNASSEGAFLTGDYYVGKHGRSQRLAGLDATNNNAMERAIVIHGAWYANEEMLGAHGKLGRSQGCLAVGEQCLDDTFAHLGVGRLIYAARA